MIARSLLVLGALALPAAAQTSQPTKPTKPKDDARQRAAALVQKLAFNKGLVGTTRLGFYQNTKNQGTMTITVAKAPPASGAAYRVTIKAVIAFRDMKNSMSKTVLLGPGLDLVQADGKQSMALGMIETKRIARKGGLWRYTATHEEGGKRKTGELTAADGANHWEAASQILLSRVLGRRPPGRYALRGVKWPTLGSSGWLGGGRAKWANITFVVGKPEARTIRGTARQIIPVKMIRAGNVSEAQTFLVDASGAFYGLESDHSPMRLVAGTDAQVATDLEPSGEGPAIRSVVRVWFEVTCRKKLPAALDPVTDWAAVAAARKKADPSLKDKTVMDIAAAAKKLLLANPLPEKALKAVDSKLKVRVRGDKARVWFDAPHQVVEWKLVKSGKAWKLVDFPTKLGRH